MRTLIRVAVVLVVVLAYLGAATFFASWRDAAKLNPVVEFGNAVDQARFDDSHSTLRPSLPVCGFPPKGKRAYSLPHSEVARVAHCLHLRGYLSAATAAKIEDSQITISGFQNALSPVEGAPTGSVQFAGGWTYSGAPASGREWWFSALLLAGLVLLVWLVGFGLPWWRVRSRG